MMAILLRGDVSASRIVAKDGSSTLQVDKAQLAQAIDMLKAQGYPRESFANIGEVFKSSGFVSSPVEERARFIFAISEELSRTISSIDGVLSARVHVVLPRNDALRMDQSSSSASVFIRHEPEAGIQALLPQVKQLVANSIENLSYDKVSVVLVASERQDFSRAATTSSIGAAAVASPAGLTLPSGSTLAALFFGLLGAGYLIGLRPDGLRLGAVGSQLIARLRRTGR